MLTILYVDDESALLDVVKIFFEARGEFTIDTATSPDAAFPLISSKEYDAVVSDYQMPGMDGIAFLKELRHRNPDLPFILFTGRGREEVVIDAINNGADFYIQKGGEIEAQFAELAHKIRQAVKRRKTEQELKKSEFRLRSFIETTHESVAIVDEEGKVTEWNAATERMTGIRKEEALGRYLWDLTARLLPAGDRTDERIRFIEQRIRASLKTGIPVFEEPRIIESMGPSGSRIFTRQTLFPIKTGKGFGIGSVSQDITAEKEAEEILRESEKRYHDLADLLPQIIFEVDLNLQVTYANWHAFTTLGFTQKQIDDRTRVLSFLVPSDHEKVRENMKKFLQGTPLGPQEYTALRKDMSTFPVLVYTAPIYRDKKLCGFRGVAVDLSEQKKIEDALRTSEERFRGMAERSSDLILLLDNTMSPTYVSPSVRPILGYEPGELVGKTPEYAMTTIFSETGPALMSAVKETMSGKPVDHVELQLSKKDKTPVIVSMFAVPVLRDGTLEGVQVSMRDITESTATRSALQAVIGSMVGTTGLNSLEKIVETVSSWLGVDCVMIGEIQPDHDTVNVLAMILDGKQVRDFIYHLKGTPCENVAEKGFCYYPDDSVRLFPHAKDIIDLNIQGYVGTPLWNSQRKVVGILCALSRKPMQLSPSVKKILDTIAVKAGAEIERTQIGRELQKSQDAVQKAMDLANLVNWQLDPRTGLFTFNDRFYALYGTSAEREGGYQMTPEKYNREFVHPEDQDIVAAAYGGPPPSSDTTAESQLEHRIIRRDGEIRTIMVRVGVSLDSGGQDIIVHGANQDITDRKKMEEAIRQANRKLSLLSGITRHDIGNQLLVLEGFIAILQREIRDSSADKYFSRITDASKNIADMIQFTKEYEKIGTGSPVWQDLTSVITIAGKGIIPEQFTLKNDLPARTEVFADPMLEKVFFNLLDNAIRHGERVTEIHVSSRTEGGTLVVAWEDNGTGIAADDKEYIFDRGFGKNTGLGMFLVREILSLTGISIVENGEAGKGARFEISVPVGSWRIAGT